MEDLGNGTYKVTYTVEVAGVYVIQIAKNGEVLPFSEDRQNINVNSTQASHKRWLQTFSVVSSDLMDMQLAVKNIRQRFISSGLVSQSKVRLPS